MSLAYHINIVLDELATLNQERPWIHHSLVGLRRLVNFVLSSQIESTETVVDGLARPAAPMRSSMNQTGEEDIVDSDSGAIDTRSMSLLAFQIDITLATLIEERPWIHHCLVDLCRLVDYVLSSQIESTEIVVDRLICLAAPMTSWIRQTDNEYIVGDICDAIENLAKNLGVAFQLFADRVLMTLLDMATVPKKDVRDAGMMCRSATRCVDALTTYTRYSGETLCEYYDKSRASWRRSAKRDLVIKQFGTMIKTWAKSEMEPYFLLVKGVLHQALHDKSLTVRVQSREVFVLFCDLWSDRLTEFLYLPSPKIRTIIIHQHTESKIGFALKAKFAKTPPKP